MGDARTTVERFMIIFLQPLAEQYSRMLISMKMTGKTVVVVMETRCATMATPSGRGGRTLKMAYHR